MTGREHYAEAERLLAGRPGYNPSEGEVAQAHVHATLALAAASMRGPLGVTFGGDPERAER